jgi:hypothetical protein
MRAGNWACATLTLTLAACTQSYDSFDFAGGAPVTGGGTTTTAAGGSGGIDGTGGSGAVGPVGGNGGAPSVGGSGGEGGMPVVQEVPCGNGGTCDGGDVCCVSENGSTNGSCQGSCNPGNEASLGCNEPSDCPDGVCCLVFNGRDYDAAECKARCGANDQEICDPETSEPCVGDCEQVADLPAGYKTCP